MINDYELWIYQIRSYLKQYVKDFDEETGEIFY
jgi:hypothetical protein